MAKAFLFHNPRCSKSRQALNLLEKEKENFEVFMYLDEKLEKDFLKEIIQKLGMSPRDLLRTGESAYKENNLKDSNISEDEIINLMIEHPKLIERPIYVKGSKAISVIIPKLGYSFLIFFTALWTKPLGLKASFASLDFFSLPMTGNNAIALSPFL